MDATIQPQVSSLQTFMDNLVAQRFAGRDNITQEIKEELIREAFERLDNFLLDRTINAFSDADAQTFSTMLDEKKPVAELQTFAKEHIPDYTNFLTSNIKEFKEIYLG